MTENSIPPIEFRDPRRARLHEQLASLGPGPASLYRDACRVFDGLISAETASRIAGHLQRELLSSVQDVLLPFGYEDAKAGDDPKIVQRVLRSLELPQETDTKRLQKTLAKFFKPQSGGGISKVKVISQSFGLPFEHEIVTLSRDLNLHTIAHRFGLEAAPPLDSVRETWERFQRLLSVMLDHFEKSFASAYGKIRAAIDAKDLGTFRTKVPQNAATLAYFYEHVDGDEWFNILRDIDMLTVPPPGGGWPAVHYLQRVAPSRPSEVRDILLAIRTTNNEFVLMGMIATARALAPDDAVRVLDRLKHDTLLLRPESFIPDDLADAAASYALSHPTAVRGILLPFLELNVAAGEGAGGALASRDLVARVDIHTYMEIVSGPLQQVIAADPRPAFEELLRLFDAALQAEYGAEDDVFTSAWRPAIEPHEQNHEFEPLPHLLDAVRIAAEQTCKTEPTSAEDVVRIILKYRWTIFRRLALHVARVALPATEKIARELTLDPVTLRARDTRHESHLLMASVFPKLDATDREKVIEGILAGPDREDEDEPERIRRWKAQRLGWIAAELPRSVRQIYDELGDRVAELDESADFDFYTTGMFVGPTSPKNAAEFARESVSEVADFLRTWMPPRGSMVDTREGVARELSAVVEVRAADYASTAELFIGLDPTYVRAFLSGLTEGVRNGTVIEWAPVLRLMSWAVAQPRDIPGRSRRGLDDDPHWGWARAQMGRVLQQGFRRKTVIPAEFRRDVWAIVLTLTEDPDPDASRDERQQDPLTTAINSTRGVAFETVIGYAAWIRGSVFGPPDLAGPPFHDMPEVETVLTQHLNPQIDASPAMRAVYGQNLYLLHLLSPDWVTTHLQDLAPPSFAGLADAMWQTYLVYGFRFSSATLRDFRPLIERAVYSLQNSKSLYREYPRRLAHLVLHLYFTGKESLQKNSLIDEFFRKADNETRTYAIGLVPQLLRDESEPEQLAPWIDRATALWDWRKEVSTDGEEMAGFGFWMVSDHFEEEWRLRELRVAVDRAGVPQYEHAVIEALAQLVAKHPLLVIDAARSLVQNAGGYMELYRLTYRGELRAIVTTALGSHDPEIQKAARELANTLIAKGFNDFLDLL